MVERETGEPVDAPIVCPHGDDKGHGGLGRGWCEAGLEGERYLRDLERRREEARRRG